MRLVCPNCGAQYEVPADAIPPAGRDVQCSACGHTWFEGDADVAALDDADPSAGVPRVENDDEEADDLAEAGLDDQPGGEAPPADSAPGPARSSVPPEVAGILRSEAEREARAREAERPAATLHAAPPDEASPAAPARALSEGQAPAGTSPDAAARPAREPAPVPVPEPDGRRERLRAEEARRRMARLRASPPPARAAPRPLVASQPAGAARPEAAEAAVPSTPTSRRARLPDIEEINSSLRGAPPAAPAASPPAARGGFRLGFGGMLLLGAALALAYAYAPQLTGAVPAARVVLDPYVAAVDEGRLWLDLRLQGLLQAVDGPAEPEATPDAEADAAPDATAGPAAEAAPPSAPGPTRPEAAPPDAPPATLPEGLAAPEPDDAPAAQTLTVPAAEPAAP